jgi:site-specific DNA recombinase
MQRAALYARVSTDTQKQEGTIQSQLAELKRQITAFGHELVKEYVDDGHSGKYLDRPALDELRVALKTDAFDVVYFLCADRIAQDATHQNIIISELLKYKKKIIINGKDYEENPENTFTLSVLGAVSEFERAKILERMRRGTLHRLRTGQLASHGHVIYGYDYIKKTPTRPAALVINHDQAAIVRTIFDMYANGRFSLAGITRWLEERGIRTRRGNLLWNKDHIRVMLKNTTYVGTRYYNRITDVREPSQDGRRKKTPKRVYRDPQEWIALRVPPIISQEVFDKAQERLRLAKTRYCQPKVKALLGGLVRCAECGRLYSSLHSYAKVVHPTGTVSVYHRAQYRCTTAITDHSHHAPNIRRCRNTRHETHILDAKVVAMIREVMLDPTNLSACLESNDRVPQPKAARQLTRMAEDINGLEKKRHQLIERYATDGITHDEYIKTSREFDDALLRITREKAAATRALRDDARENAIAASIHHFCASARARFEACADIDAKRTFLRDHIEKIIFNHGKLTIVGSLPLQGATTDTKLPFRIEGEIDRAVIRSKAARRLWADERTTSWMPAATPGPISPRSPGRSNSAPDRLVAVSQ